MDEHKNKVKVLVKYRAYAWKNLSNQLDVNIFDNKVNIAEVNDTICALVDWWWSNRQTEPELKANIDYYISNYINSINQYIVKG